MRRREEPHTGNYDATSAVAAAKLQLEPWDELEREYVRRLQQTQINVANLVRLKVE